MAGLLSSRRSAIAKCCPRCFTRYLGENGIFYFNPVVPKFFKKELATARAFDTFLVPFARKAGRTACLQTDNCFQQEQE
jgi:hypothetical protein